MRRLTRVVKRERGKPENGGGLPVDRQSRFRGVVLLYPAYRAAVSGGPRLFPGSAVGR